MATISQTSGPRLLVNESNVHVSGDLTGQSGERGYLEVTFTYPEGGQVGDGGFSCEANAANDIGRNIVFSTSTSVQEKEVSLGDLVKQIHDMQVGDSGVCLRFPFVIC